MEGFLATLQTKLTMKLEGTGYETMADETSGTVVDEPDLEDELENL